MKSKSLSLRTYLKLLLPLGGRSNFGGILQRGLWIYIIYKMMANLIWEKESSEKHYEDDLVKYVCYGCDKEFIVGKHFAETSDQLRCPYCGQVKDLDVRSEATGEWLEELELGCFGMSYTIDKNGNQVTHPLDIFEKEIFYNRQNKTNDEIHKRFIELVQQKN